MEVKQETPRLVTMISKSLLTLCHNKWSIPVLAQLYKSKGAKFVALVNVLSVGPSTLNRTLNALVKQELVCKNPGFGHPLRPEYILSNKGDQMASLCADIYSELIQYEAGSSGVRKWTLPILVVLSFGSARFIEIRHSLAPITPNALASSLKHLAAMGIIEREISDSFPPCVRYQIKAEAIALRRLMIAMHSASVYEAFKK